MTKLTSKTWWGEVGYRAIKTMAQAALSLVTVGNAVTDMDWVAIASITVAAGIACVLTQIASLPELTTDTIAE